MKFRKIFRKFYRRNLCKMVNFNAIVNELQIKIAEKMDCATQIEFELSSKHGRDIVRRTRHVPVYEADTLSIIVSVIGFLNIGVQAAKDRHFDLYRGSPLPRQFSVSKVILGGILELEHLENLETVEFTNNEVELNWWGTPIQIPIFVKLAEKFNFTRCVCLEAAVNPENREFLDLPNVVEFKRIHFCLNYGPFNKLRLYELKATDIILRLKKFSWGRDLDAAPLIAPKTNKFFKQWFQKEREIEWFRITSETLHPDDTTEILLSGLPVSIFWKGRHAKIKMLKEVIYKSTVYDLTEENIVYTLDRGDKKLLILLKGMSEIIAQELNNKVVLTL